MGLCVLARDSSAIGAMFYGMDSGALFSQFDPVLSGGDFAGRAVSSLSPSEILGIRDNGGSELVLLAVPEPSSGLLLALGLAAFAVGRKTS